MQNNTPKFAVVLSGCGVFDGSEIHEAVMTLLAIEREGLQYQCFAPNVFQTQTVNHANGETEAKAGDDCGRNVLNESARICRGNIRDLQQFDPQDYDALVFPGGLGAAMNLCNFGIKGADCDVNPIVREAIEKAHQRGLPIGAMCIAPVILAKVLGAKGVKITIGNDITTAEAIEKMGAKHEIRGATEVCVDEKHKIATTPCYMLAHSMPEIAEGTANLIKAIIKM